MVTSLTSGIDFEATALWHATNVLLLLLLLFLLLLIK